MAKSQIEQEIQARTEAFAAELSVLIRKAALEAVEAALAGSGVAAPSRRGKKSATAKKATKKKATRKKRGRRNAADIEALATQVHEFVMANKGSRLEEISAGIGVPSKELKRPVTDLLAAKALRKEGQKRGTKYFAKKA
jgi:hypothetical protein